MSSVGMQMSPPGSFFSAGKEPAHLAGSAGYAKPDMEWALRGAASSIHLEVVPTLRVLAFSCATTLQRHLLPQQPTSNIMNTSSLCRSAPLQAEELENMLILHFRNYPSNIQ
jgi:hypothetical protein